MSTGSVIYLDSSAIVKLVVNEPESAALYNFLENRRPLVSSALARVEVSRAVLPFGSQEQRAAKEVLGWMDLMRISSRILGIAGTLQPDSLRTLDAIHLASAVSLEDTLAEFVCYDRRLSQAAANQGWAIASPT
ncbi:MAG: type II toxin-antitoxin system VapC family toxin [bacterium]|nr:type II toxin-antitoxin system VapC family toxin [bacterium]